MGVDAGVRVLVYAQETQAHHIYMSVAFRYII